MKNGKIARAHIKKAPVAQWIERWPPEPEA